MIVGIRVIMIELVLLRVIYLGLSNYIWLCVMCYYIKFFFG